MLGLLSCFRYTKDIVRRYYDVDLNIRYTLGLNLCLLGLYVMVEINDPTTHEHPQ